jgi:hypothetical protein
MSELGEAIDWVPLHAALAWVATRDSHEFQWAMEHLDGERYAIDSWESETRALRLNERDALKKQNAWLELRSAIAAEKVKARGFPHKEKIAAPPTPRPIMHISMGKAVGAPHYGVAPNAPVANRPVTPPVDPSKWTIEDGEEEDWSEPTNSQVPASEVCNLVLGSTGRLRPADWAILGGQGWHSVVISRLDLVAAFPVDAISDDEDDEEDESDEDEGQEDIEGPPFAVPKLAWKRHMLQEIILERFPHGIPPMDPEAKVKLFQSLLREKLEAKAEKENLGPAALERAGKITVGYSSIMTAARKLKKPK